MLRDTLGLTLSGATVEGLAAYEQAIRKLQCFRIDPVALADKAAELAPGFVMAHVLKAYLLLLGTEPQAVPMARDCLAQIRDRDMTGREKAHLAAAGSLTEGRWHAAGRILEDIAIETPRDILALQVGHQVDFFTGHARMLRDRVARALPVWDERMPGFHSILGMHAFGLEEMGDYAAAEKAGRRAVELEPRDGWAQHAVAHVMEMQGRQRDGIAWMRGNEGGWAPESFLAGHNWWHLALYHLDLDEIDEVMKLFDDRFYPATSNVVLEMIDATAMLWRLHLRGIDVGDRWERVARAWRPLMPATGYAFNDAHAVMTFVGQGDLAAADTVIQAQKETIAHGGDNGAFTADVGYPVARAIRAFGAGDYAQSAALLRQVRSIAGRFGGSHAQRDILDLTLIEAAFRAGDQGLASALAAERMATKPSSPQNQGFWRRAARVPAAA